jgi:hypothetical protein
MISAATNDAVFSEFDHRRKLEQPSLLIFLGFGSIYQVGKTIVLYGGLGCTLMIE